MSDSPAFDFGKFIPGFDFLQNLATSAKGPAGPVSALHHWVAPTVSVEELDKRIAELNAEFRGKPKPTNVLSWPAIEFGPRLPGEHPDLPEIEELGEMVRARVLAHSGVGLEWEIKRMGEFAL